MALPVSLPEKYKIVQLDSAITAANALDCDIISCKNAHKVWFVVSHGGASDADLTLSLVESTDVTGSTTTAVTAKVPIWVDADAGASSDTLVKQADAASYVINTGSSVEQLVVIEWDPAKFSAGYDCIKLSDSGGGGSNVVNAIAIIETRYPQATPPAAITD